MAARRMIRGRQCLLEVRVHSARSGLARCVQLCEILASRPYLSWLEKQASNLYGGDHSRSRCVALSLRARKFVSEIRLGTTARRHLPRRRWRSVVPGFLALGIEVGRA